MGNNPAVNSRHFVTVFRFRIMIKNIVTPQNLYKKSLVIHTIMLRFRHNQDMVATDLN